MTNADYVHKMSDAEFADFLVNKLLGWVWCDSTAPVDPVTKDCLKNGGSCLTCCRDWLRQEHNEKSMEDDE